MVTPNECAEELYTVNFCAWFRTVNNQNRLRSNRSFDCERGEKPIGTEKFTV